MLILAGIGLHVGYQFLLMASYDAGDLTQVYPLARGSAPVIVALVSVALLGVSLQPVELGAVKWLLYRKTRTHTTTFTVQRTRLSLLARLCAEITT